MKISKEKVIVIFYILYFTWLLSITYLIRDILYINYFSIGVTAFYFLFLKEKDDIVLFLIAAGFSLILTFYIFDSMNLPMNIYDLNTTPLWLPLAWGVTTVSLKKFAYILMYR